MGNIFMDHSSDWGVQLNGGHTNKTVHKTMNENDISEPKGKKEKKMDAKRGQRYDGLFFFFWVNQI